MAFIAGVRVKELSAEKAVTTIKFGWLTQNPFRSMYFACQSMAAEMSTALLVLDAIYDSTPAVSMLIIQNKATFHKKAIGKITFTCIEGKHVTELISKVKQGGEGITTDLKSIGVDESGEMVAEFIFTWSLKAKIK